MKLIPIRIFWKQYPAVDLYFGPWMIRICLDTSCGGTFGNGSRRHSGWHRWKRDSEF